SGLDADSFSIGLWVKPYGSSNSSQFLIGREEYSLSLSAHKVEFSISGDSGASCGSPTTLLSSSKTSRYQWNYIMATYDGSEMKVYINGVEDVNTATHNSGICTVENNPFLIGENTTGARYRGLMDEVLFFDNALTDTQVDTLYNYQFYFFDATQQHPIVIDATGPESTLELNTDVANEPVLLSISSIDDYSVVKDVISVTVTSPSNTVDVLSASQDESGTGLWYFMFTPDAEGEYTVDMEATDAVGNVGSSQEFIYVDDTPSSATLGNSLTSSILTTNPESLADDNSLQILGGISDDRALGNTVSIDIQDWLGTTVQAPQITEVVATTDAIGTWEQAYLFPQRAYGEYTVVASSEDFVGNPITETIGLMQIDDFGPWSDITVNKTYIISGSETLGGTVNDIHYNYSGRTFHFHLDESSGATTFVDSTQRKFEATCDSTQCPTAGEAGQYETAVLFDGSNDLLQVAADDIFAMSTGTLMAWVNPTWNAGSNGYDPTILAVDDGLTTNFRWQLADDYSAMVLVTDSGTESIPITINPNEWTHLALVMEEDSWAGYVNGISTEPVTQTFGLQSGLPFNIGATNESEGNFTGMIDEVVVYSHALSIDDVYDSANPLATTITQLEIQARHLNGAIWPEVDPDGLKMYLPLDDPNGVTDFNHTSLISEAVSCDDENDGCPTAGVAGAFSSSTAVEFDGDDYIEIPDSADLDLEQITVSFWVKTDSSSFNDNLVTKGRDGWEINMHPTEGDGGIVFNTQGLVDVNNSSVSVLESDISVDDNQWHHVVVLYDGTTKKIYIDGSLAGSQEVIGSLPVSDQPLVIGSNFGSTGISTDSALNGAIDEVAIFNRALTEDEILTLHTWETWQTVTLDSPDSFYSTWTATIPDGLEGLYTIGLRATDSVGNQLTNPEAWTGPIDLRAPLLSLDYISLPDNNVQVYCQADDLNIADDGWVCPAGDPISEVRQASDWFVDYFSPMTRTVGLQSSVQTINTTSDGTMTACDLHGNCRTTTMSQQSVAEGVAILSPVNGTVLNNFEPITIQGEAWSDQGIHHVNIKVNGSRVDFIQWGESKQVTQDSWEITWTPPVGVATFELEAELETINDGIFIDESETIIYGPSLAVEKSVSPELVSIGDTVTYTVVVSNNGLNSLEDVSVNDTLPSGVTPVTAVTGISETVDIGVGEAVTYTIPATVTAGQGEAVTNTVSVDHVTFSGQDSATFDVCYPTFTVTSEDSSGPGTLQDGVDNVCDYGTINFSEDMIFGSDGALDGFEIDIPVTIDGSGFNLNFDTSETINPLLTILEDVGPVTLINLNFVQPSVHTEIVSGVKLIVVEENADLTIFDTTMNVGNPDEFVITNEGELTFINSQLWGSRDLGGNVISNTSNSVLTFQNSTVDMAIGIEAGGLMIADHTTFFGGQSNINLELEDNIVSSSGIQNEGTVRLSSSILVTDDTDCSGSGTYEDLGYNLFSSSSSCPTDSGTSVTVGAADLFTTVLNPLDDNGGPTPTYALIAGGPAIDIIPQGENDCDVVITADQRGAGRPENGMCDSGAYEVSNTMATDDSAVTAEETAVTIDVLANDSDADSDPIMVDSVSSQPTSGTVVNNGTDVVYTPNDDFSGSDSFTYKVVDDNVGVDWATVVVTVNGTNDAPVAVDDDTTTDEDTAVTIDVLSNDTDIDGDLLTVDSIAQPISGSIVINPDGSDLTYTPVADFNGSDSFTYTVSDGNGGSDTASVVVTVNSVNDAPIAFDDIDVTTDEDTAVTIDVLSNDTDVESDQLTVDSVTQPANGSVVNNGSDVIYTPTADFSGSNSFTYTIGDGNGGSATATVTVTINSLNDVPVAMDDSSITNGETAVIIDVLSNDTDADGDTLTVDSVTDPANGTIINNGSDVTYTPNAGYEGDDTFTYTVSDGNGGSDVATVTVTVDGALVAAYQLDDPALSVFADSSGQGYTATCATIDSCPTYTTDVVNSTGFALAFDGSNDYVIASSIVDPATTNVTAATWFYLSADQDKVMLAQQNGSGTGSTWLKATTDGQLQ
ncbi:MAG: tandem-95 repeat protein, partial [Chloroflexi bacterium]|nr:tandem-95 repeat protein [Chloroflexota bacterium]